MSTLQVANLHFESTGNNRLQYTGSNSYLIVAGGTNVATVNTTTFNFTGEFRVSNNDISTIGQHTIWIPATAMTPTTSSGAAFATITQGDIQTTVLAYDSNNAEYAGFVIQMPKSWNEGTIIFQPVWTHPATSTNFGVAWIFNARAFSDNEAPSTFTTTGSSTDTGGTTNQIYIGPESSAYTVENTPSAEDLVVYRVGRLPTDASDTMAVDAYLIGVKIHYTIDAGRDD